MKRILFVIVFIGLLGISHPVEAAGSCTCAIVGQVTSIQCVPAEDADMCRSKGDAMRTDPRQSFDCRFFLTRDCTGNGVLLNRIEPIGAPPGSTTGSSAVDQTGGGNPGVVEFQFPQPALQIPEINVRIPGLTNFLPPHPAACPPGLGALGFSSCRTFPWLGQYIEALYPFGIAVAAFLAIVMIMWGGFLYITSSGIASQAENGKHAVQMAFLGLILAFTSYTLLATINPALVRFDGLKVPDVAVKSGSIQIPAAPAAPGYEDKGEPRAAVDDPVSLSPNTPISGAPGGVGSVTVGTPSTTAPASPGSTTATPAPKPLPAGPSTSSKPCPYARPGETLTDFSAEDLALCPRLPPALGTYQGVKPAANQPGGRITDRASAKSVDVMNKIIAATNDPGAAQVIGEWWVTEGWPPTVQHDSSCHFTGCAIDLALRGDATDERIAAMEKVLNSFKNNKDICYVLNEYEEDSAHKTGGHFHIRVC